jgi:energy-coupling factor transporter ATP-binding protein EcfA2
MQEMEDCPQPIPGCEHLCFANFPPDDNEDTLPKARRGYDPLTEEHVPACDSAHMHPMKAEAEITSIYNRLLEKITSIPQNDNTLQALAARCRSEVSALPRSVRQIALVGETGVGKSTLINVLLGRPGQQKVANAVSRINGCTSAVIRYKYGTKLSNGGKSFRARVNFLGEDALREVLQDFKDDFVDFHLGEASDDKNPCKNTDFKRATGARHFYEFLWDQNFGDDDLKGRIVEPKFFEQTVAQSLRLISRVATQPATTTTSAYLEEFDNSSTKLLTRINKYLSQSKPADVIWCLVSDVDIYIESHVLKAGIVLVDLPGKFRISCN